MESITNTLQDILPTLEEIKSGALSFIQHGIAKESQNLPALIVIIILSLLTCFFGLKMIRFFAAVIGLFIGTAAGYCIGLYFGLGQVPSLAAGIVAGIILAVLSGVLMLFGVFMFAWIGGAYLGIVILNPQNLIMSLVCAAIGLVLGIVTLKFTKSLTIILTAAAGGMSAGFAIVQVAGLEQWFLPYVIGAALIVIGIIIQFFYISKKTNKKIIEKAEKIKQEVSVENDIEAAKSILDQIDTDDEPAAEEAPAEEAVEEELAREFGQVQEQEPIQAEPIQDLEDIMISEDDFEEEPAEEESAEEDPNKKLEEAMIELERVKRELEEAKKAKQDS